MTTPDTPAQPGFFRLVPFLLLRLLRAWLTAARFALSLSSSLSNSELLRSTFFIGVIVQKRV